MRKFMSVLAFCAFVLLFISNNVWAGINIPDKIRIGLYYDSSAQPSVAIAYQNGVTAASVESNSIMKIAAYPGSGSLTIRKDDYFVKTGNILVAYDPNSPQLPQGDRFGPYHIEIAAGFDSFDKAMEMVTAVKDKGIVSYPAFDGQWKIWTGLYTDSVLAQNDMTNIRNNLGDAQYTVIGPLQNDLQLVGSDGSVIMIYAGAGRLQLQSSPNNGNTGIIAVNGKDFRGDMEFRRFAGSDMTVINILPFEEYLYGVVPREIGANSEMEALKAQAIAARTYALMNIGKHASRDFDLCAWTDCQVYGGYDIEDAKCNKAVNDTVGKKVMYNGKLASVFYFSSDGGRTEDVQNVWGSDRFPYLVSVEDKYESPNSYRYLWEISLPAQKIKDILVGKQKGVGDILSVKPSGFSDSGRVTRLVVTGTGGPQEFLLEKARTVFSLYSQWYTVSTDADVSMMGAASTQPVTGQLAGTNIAAADGIKVLQQTKNTVKVIGANGVTKDYSVVPVSYTFKGRGWGHAVGMSQEGARGMAKAGFTYGQIITYFLPGTSVE